jgi:biopolymer transport protein ExbD
MPKIKVPRKSTNIDMTAMCDVAFLLLSFFILATQFKPEDALTVVTPKSVSTRALEGENIVMITMDKEGKVYFSVDDENETQKKDIIDEINSVKNLGLTDAEKANFTRVGSFVGVPFNQLKAYLQQNPDNLKNVKQPGIPVTDTLNNELQVWMRAAVGAFQNKKMNILVKGDNDAKYPSFEGVIEALKKNDQMKFSMITDPEGIPPNSELGRRAAKEGAKVSDQQ